jgi:hypothetical protein
VTAAGCADAANCPVPDPATVDLRRLRTVEIPAYQPFYTAYRSQHWPAVFNPGVGDTRFAPLQGADGSAVATLYGAATRTVSLLENVFHEVHAGGGRLISTAVDLAGRGLVELRRPAPLRLIDLSDVALERLGLGIPGYLTVRSRLVATGPEHYPCTREWGRRLHARGKVGGHLPVGLGWRSRISELAGDDAVLLGDLLTDASALVFVLFGDRVGVDLRGFLVGERYPDLAADGAGGLVLAIAEQLKATIV